MASFEHSGDERRDDELHGVRHSLAHVLAQAVLEMQPGTTLGFCPPLKDGFYYDFIISEPLTEADFPEIERRMSKIIKKGEREAAEGNVSPASPRSRPIGIILSCR